MTSVCIINGPTNCNYDKKHNQRVMPLYQNFANVIAVFSWHMWKIKYSNSSRICFWNFKIRNIKITKFLFIIFSLISLLKFLFWKSTQTLRNQINVKFQTEKYFFFKKNSFSYYHKTMSNLNLCEKAIKYVVL